MRAKMWFGYLVAISEAMEVLRGAAYTGANCTLRVRDSGFGLYLYDWVVSGPVTLITVATGISSNLLIVQRRLNSAGELCSSFRATTFLLLAWDVALMMCCVGYYSLSTSVTPWLPNKTKLPLKAAAVIFHPFSSIAYIASVRNIEYNWLTSFRMKFAVEMPLLTLQCPWKTSQMGYSFRLI